VSNPLPLSSAFRYFVASPRASARHFIVYRCPRLRRHQNPGRKAY
jgi:hypothetical protein